MSTSSECATCLGMNHECPDCEHESGPEPEKWKHAGQGKCAGCDREVKNRWTRGKGAACLPCLWGAWAGSPS